VSEEQQLLVTTEESGKRLDRLVAARFPSLSRAQLQRLIKSGALTVNRRPSKPSYRAEAGDKISFVLPETPEEVVQPEPIPLDIVYEDQVLLAVNKPAGMVVHPATGHTSGTLVNALLAYMPQIADVSGQERAGIVHRLDKDTSGLLLVAKDSQAHAALQRQFQRRRVHKTYLALVEGRVRPTEGIIDVPVGRDHRERKRMAAVRTGRPATTHYRVRENFRRHTLLEARPHTGRTHQVRVHLSWLGHPIVGDRVYGRRRQGLLPDRHFLHAHELRFSHPTTGEELTLIAPLPPELEALLVRLREERARPGK